MKSKMSDMEIMCTLTPAQVFDQEELVKAMYDAGMRSVRINTAHLQGVDMLHALASKLKSMLPDVKILIDTKGPEMRTTAISCTAYLFLHTGESLIVEGTSIDSPTTAGHIYVNYPFIHKAVSVGDQLLIDDGHIVLDVEKVEGRCISARVSSGGVLGSRKGFAVKDVDVDLPAVSAHDRMYISWSATSDLIDVIAHSFVRSAADVIAVKEVMKSTSHYKPIIAKIENQQGIDHLDAILAEADGILIARGDLTASLGKEAIPQAQAHIAQATKNYGLPLYLATNILPSLMLLPSSLSSVEAPSSSMTFTETPSLSMTSSEAPSSSMTSYEASIIYDFVSADDIEGIRLAKSQGVDVMLLTNETASGPMPLQSVIALHAAMA